jgi:hypothetical protein
MKKKKFGPGEQRPVFSENHFFSTRRTTLAFVRHNNKKATTNEIDKPRK